MKEILGFFALIIVIGMARSGIKKIAATVGVIGIAAAVLGGLFGWF